MNKYNLEFVVDVDLSKCFDTLDHEIILKAISMRVSDGSVLRLIRKFLKAGVMESGVIDYSEVGSPQAVSYHHLL